MSDAVNVGPWRLNGTTAELVVGDLGSDRDCGECRARIDLLDPRRGLHDVHHRGAVLAGTWLGLDIDLGSPAELSLPETYVRGDDLVATYMQTEARPFRLQAYWRRIDRGVVELQVSINTSLLDTQPFVDVVSTAASGAWSEKAPQRFWLRPATAETVWFQAAHPNDPARSTLDGLRLTQRLFDRPLEKGVILRARIRAAVLDRSDPEHSADAVFADFSAAALPLTT